MESSCSYFIEATWCACQTKWHTAINKISAPFDIECSIGSTFFCDLNRIKARCKVKHGDPAMPAQCLLFRTDIALRHWEDLRDLIEPHIVGADPPFLR